MRRPRPAFLGLSCVLLLASCGARPAGDLSTATDEIFGGTVDTTNDAVLALVHQMGMESNGCTGTTIAKVGASGIFLTAGHCVIQTDGMGHPVTPIKVADPSELYIIPGPDWVTSLRGGLYFGVVDVKAHPSYDGNVNSPFDIALVRYVGTTASTKVVPALAPEEDKLAVGSTITLVGFGKTETNAMNSQRRKVDRTISQINTQQFVYDQSDLKGACQGDSGGPAFFQATGGTRVAGVTSFGDPDCTMLGASVRVSPFASFIQSFISGAPAALDCSSCTLAAVGPGNACVTQGIACGQSGTPCGKFLACASACTNDACIGRCNSSQPQGAAAYQDMVRCQCGNSCAAVCKSNAACAAVGGGTTGAAGTGGTAGIGGTAGTGVPGGPVCGGVTDSRPDCASCIKTSCCGEASACAADATCAGCLTNPSAPACATNAAFTGLTSCEATCPACAGAAAGGSGGGGSGGGGGCRAGGATPPAASVGPIVLLAALAFFARRKRRP